MPNTPDKFTIDFYDNYLDSGLTQYSIIPIKVGKAIEVGLLLPQLMSALEIAASWAGVKKHHHISGGVPNTHHKEANPVGLLCDCHGQYIVWIEERCHFTQTRVGYGHIYLRVRPDFDLGQVIKTCNFPGIREGRVYDCGGKPTFWLGTSLLDDPFLEEMTAYGMGTITSALTRKNVAEGRTLDYLEQETYWTPAGELVEVPTFLQALKMLDEKRGTSAELVFSAIADAINKKVSQG